MGYKILAINPGSTSTKIAVYEDEQMIFSKAINPVYKISRQAPLMGSAGIFYNVFSTSATRRQWLGNISRSSSAAFSMI